jgi:hypothetical protein
MVVATRANASSTISNVEVVSGTTSKTPVFSGNLGDDWTIWEMKMSAHLMEKGLDACSVPTFETRLPNKESGPFEMTVEDKKNQKEAVDMNNEQEGNVPVYSSFLDDESSKQGHSAKESRQELPEWKSMETVVGTSRQFQSGRFHRRDRT